MNSLTAVVTIFATALFIGTSADDKKCTQVTPLPNLDLSKIMGDWHTVLFNKDNEGSDEQKDKCLNETYSQGDAAGSLNLELRSTKPDGTLLKLSFAGTQQSGGGFHFELVNDATIVYDSAIVAANYDNYLIWAWCNEKDDGKAVHDVTVYGRKTTLSDTMTTEVHNKLKDAGIPDNLKPADQTGC